MRERDGRDGDREGRGGGRGREREEEGLDGKRGRKRGWREEREGERKTMNQRE